MVTNPVRYSVAEAADILGLGQHTVRDLIRSGYLAAVAIKVHNRFVWRVTDLTRRTGAQRLPPQYMRDSVGGRTDLAKVALDLVLPEWRTAEANATNQAADYAVHPIATRAPSRPTTRRGDAPNLR